MVKHTTLPYKNSTSGYKGVHCSKKTGKYEVRIQKDKKTVYVGTFDNLDEAVSAYKTKSIELYGENDNKPFNDNDYHKEWHKKNPGKFKKYLSKNKVQRNEKRKIDAQQLRLETIAAYGNICECCGEHRHELLTIDHIDGTGNIHRKQGGKKGIYFYAWLRKEGWPKDNYRLLCYNCNCCRGARGFCPHEKEREAIHIFILLLPYLEALQIG
jgi:hypothetical protein